MFHGSPTPTGCRFSVRYEVTHIAVPAIFSYNGQPVATVMRKQYAIRAASSVLSFVIGVNFSHFLRNIRTPPAQETPAFSITVSSRAPVDHSYLQKVDPFLLNRICTSSDELNYEGFQVLRTYDEKAARSVVTIKKRGKALAVYSDGEGIARKEASCFGLYPILGGKTKQLLVVQTSGGAHCCFSYHIYDLQPKFRLLFDSTKYPIGDGFDELEFKDLDGDGVHEFTQLDVTFDYWEDMAYVSSPQPENVFQYNPRIKRFLPANKKFSAYLLKDIAKDINKLDPSDPAQYWRTSFEITLRYIFVGKEDLGWKFYDKQFGIRPGGRDRMKTKIKNALKRDQLYRDISWR
jgi:hypothetical protein